MKLVSVFALVLPLIWAGRPAVGCSCGERPPQEVALQGCSMVALGTVLTVRGIGEGYPEEDGNTYYADYDVTLRVERAFKGARRKRRLHLHTGYPNGACGYIFDIGRSYLVYAARSGGKLTTSICSRTSPREEATDDLRVLESLASSR